MGFRRTGSLLAAASSATLVVAGCSGSGDSGSAAAPPPPANQDVTLDMPGPATSYDPAKGSSFQDATIARTLYDPLVTIGADGKVKAQLASSWTLTPTSATFTLKPGITCSDGTKLTPDMVAASLKRYLDPATGAPFLNLALGDNTSATVSPTSNGVTVKLAKPYAGLLTGLSTSYSGIICPAGLKDPKQLQTKSFGTGPFTATSQVPGSSYTFTRRTDYAWGPTFPDQPQGKLPRQLTYKVVTDDNTRANLISTGALQAATFISDAWKKFESTPSVSVITSPQSVTWMSFNETPGRPTADEATRRAIAQAVNRQQLTTVQTYGAGQLVSNLGLPNYPCYDKSLEAKIPAYDAAAASSVLKGKQIAVMGTTATANGAGSQYIQSALQAAGATVTLRMMDNQAWVANLFGGKNDWDVTVLAYSNTVATLPAATQFMVGPGAPKGQNYGNVQNPAAAQAQSETGRVQGNAQCGAVSRVQSALLQRVDVVPLSTVPVHVVTAGGVKAAVVLGFPQASSIRLAS